MLRSRAPALLQQLGAVMAVPAEAPWWASLASLREFHSLMQPCTTRDHERTAPQAHCFQPVARHLIFQRRESSSSSSNSAGLPNQQPEAQPEQHPAVVATSAAAAAPASPADGKAVLYRGRGIHLFRLLVRLKVFQLSGVAAAIVPVTTFFAEGEVSALQVGVAGALLLGCGAASTALWYYSRRYVGELALLPAPAAAAAAATAGPGTAGLPPEVVLSVLDFWGRREDNRVPLGDFVPPLAGLPPAAVASAAGEPLLAVDVEGDRQYIISLRYGLIKDWPRLRALLEGRLHAEAGLQGLRQRGGTQQQSGGSRP